MLTSAAGSGASPTKPGVLMPSGVIGCVPPGTSSPYSILQLIKSDQHWFVASCLHLDRHLMPSGPHPDHLGDRIHRYAVEAETPRVVGLGGQVRGRDLDPRVGEWHIARPNHCPGKS